MTIKELEERTGMNRSNIRFYEREGLIAPRRRGNGYRDYSEEDARTLEKVKLLRELHLDIGAIRLVQKGELTLAQALFSLRSRLEGDRAALDRAARLCRDLERSGVNYDALDPKPWLNQLEQSRRPQLARPAQYAQEPVDNARDHPCKRVLAWVLDILLHETVVYAVLMLGFHCGETWRELCGVLGLALTMLCGPFWLHFWGWTPGKWVFGLRVRDCRGEKLTIGEGFLRGWRLFVYGWGCLLMPVTLWFVWKFVDRYRNNREDPWNESICYTCGERRLSGLMLAAGAAVCFGIWAFVTLQFYMPPNRGALTVDEFCENFNFYLDILEVGGRRVDEYGRWMGTEQGIGVTVLPDGGVVAVRAVLEYADLDLTVEDGYVTAVTLSAAQREVSARGSGYLVVEQGCCQAAVLALAGAQREFNCFTLAAEDWTGLWEDRKYSFELDHRGLHISQSVECSGYEDGGGLLDGTVLEAVEGEAQSYTRTAVISLTGG